MKQVQAVLEEGIRAGLHFGAQLYVSRVDEIVADLAIGQARRPGDADPGEPMRADTINLWMSAVKPVAAVAIAQLRERGLLDWDDRVARFVPEFGVNGKERITVRHLLTHTGGFRMGATSWTPEPWEQTVARVCAARLEPRWVPGEKAGYHPSSAWIMLGEIVRRVDPQQRTYDAYVRREIFEPLGMDDSWIGMPPERYRAYGRRIGGMYETSREPAAGPNEGVPSEATCALVRPGANGRGPIRELGRFYEMLRRGGEASAGGARVLSAESVGEITRPHRIGLFDHTFKHEMDWGLGFIVNSNESSRHTMPYGYGRFASPRTFGHSGARSSCAFCDPAHGLVVAWVCNGTPADELHQARQRAINEAIYEDLSLLL